MLQKTPFSCPAKDGLVLRGMLWSDPEVKPKAAVLYIHGMLEHYQRYDDYASFMGRQGVLFFIFDLRGHGTTTPDEENRGFFGEKDGVSNLMSDIDCVRGKMSSMLAERGLQDLPIFIYGHSMGSFITSCYVKRTQAKGFRGIILSGTNARLGVAGLAGRLARMQCILKGPKSKAILISRMAFGKYNDKCVPRRTPNDWLSHDDAVVDAYNADPGCTFIFKAAGFADLLSMLVEIGADNWTGAVPAEVPIYIFSGDADPVGQYGKGPKILYQWYKDTGHDVQLKLYPEGRHEMHNERNRQEVYEDVLSFISGHSS